MNRSRWSLPFMLVFGFLLSRGARANTVMAKSGQLTDVQTALGSASAGDTVVIPAGNWTWAGTLSITKSVTLTGSGTPNTGPSSFGAGTTSTVITDNAGNNSLINVSGVGYGQFVRISLLDLEPTPTTKGGWPIVMNGTCSASGCATFRLDNILWGKTTEWTYVPLITQTMISTRQHLRCHRSQHRPTGLAQQHLGRVHQHQPLVLAGRRSLR